MSSTVPPRATRRRPRCRAAGAAVLAALALAGCATTPSTAGSSGVLNVVAAENFWGSLAAQLGGGHVKVTSLVNNPNADPHSYEPTAADARALALANVALVNGVGYDPWATKILDANPASRRRTLDVGVLVGVREGGNPHRWYNPDDVRRVVDQLTADYQKSDPADAAFFAARHTTMVSVSLKEYFAAIGQIKAAYAGTPVGASESIFAMLAPALGLDLVTPTAFLTAMSEGNDPTPADKATIDRQITTKRLRVYVYNSQNASPDVRAQVNEASAAGVPVSTLTETLTPAGASFQDWQVAQLRRLQHALDQAAGK